MPVITSGNFWMAAANTNHTINSGSIFALDPNPTFPDYGDRLKYSFHESEGKVIKQRSTKNATKKRWVWKNYRPDILKYENQYWTLFNMQEHINVYINSGSPYVYLKEDVTDGLAEYSIAQSKLVPDWVRCRILLVQRKERQSGGVVVYDETEVIFTIDDSNFVIF